MTDAFLLSPEQGEFVEREKEILRRLLTRSRTHTGVFHDVCRYNTLCVMIEVHNIEMKKRNDVAKEKKSG